MLTIFLDLPMRGVEAPKYPADTIHLFLCRTPEEFGPPMLAEQGVKSTE